MVPHVPGLSASVQQEISRIELRAARNYAVSGLWAGVTSQALRGWDRTARDPAFIYALPCDCCGRDGRALLEEVLAELSAPAARALNRLIDPLDRHFLARTLPNPTAPADWPWWRRRIR